MHVKSVVSAIALSAAIALSGPAFAQTMFNGAVLSAEDLPAVTERCEQLAVADNTESLATDNEDDATDDATDDADNSEVTAGSAEATTDVPAVNEVQAATISTIDLETITLEQCAEAGIGAAM